MSRRTRRRLGWGALSAVVLSAGLWLFWQHERQREAGAASAAPVTLLEPAAVETTAERLAALGERFAAAAAEQDAALRQTLLEGIVADLNQLLSEGVLSAEEQVSARQLLVGVLRVLGQREATLQETGRFLDLVAGQQGAARAMLACRRLADDAFHHAQYDEAVDFYGLLQQRWPQEEEANYGAYQLGDCLRLQGRLNEALAAYESVITSYPDGLWTAKAYLQAAESAWSLGDSTKAITLYGQLRTARPGTHYPADALWRLGQHLVSDRRHTEAITAYEQLKNTLDPSWGPSIDAIIAELADRSLAN